MFRSSWMLLIVIAAVLALIWSSSLFILGGETKVTIPFDEFSQRIIENKVMGIAVTDYHIYGLNQGSKIPLKDLSSKRYDFHVVIGGNTDSAVVDIRQIVANRDGKPLESVSIQAVGFPIAFLPPATPNIWETVLPMILIAALFLGAWVWLMRQQNSRNQTFGKSRATLHVDDRNKVTFDKVAGAEEEVEELQEIVDFLKDPKKYQELGARIPKGVLLLGPPGTGKTLLAKATAGEAGVRFFSISGSDFVEMYVGVGASRVRDLFDNAKKFAPALVFIDEIDAVGRQRGTGLGGGHDEREQTLNQLLVEMDGFTANEGIIVMAATNRGDILDPALLRPGRFDRQIQMSYPDIKGREGILKVHANGKPFGPDVDLKTIARGTPYFTGADLENVLNEAALLSARRGKKQINMPELEEAIARVGSGPEKKSHVHSENDKKLVAYHEAGHALVAYLTPGADPVHEVSIIPRGQSGGATRFLPTEETRFTSRSWLRSMIAIALGGYAAEQLVLGDISTGSSSDLKRATNIAREMITQYGMSDEMGPVFFGGDQEVFLGRDYGHTRNYSEQVASKIDAEMGRLIDSGFRRAKELLSTNRAKLDVIAAALMDREKIVEEEFKSIMDGAVAAEA